MTRQRKNKVRVEREPKIANAKEVRKHGIEALEKAGILVPTTEEEWENEPEATLLK